MVRIVKPLLAVSLLILYNSLGIKAEPSNFEKTKTDRDARIVIIGAGAAGISAANHLFNNGFTNVVILEANNRISGRIFTKRFADGLIEDGASWIHGIGEKNSFYTLARSKGLSMELNLYLYYSKPYCWLTERGNCINSKAVKKAWKIYDKIVEDMDNREDITNERQSSYDYFKKGID